MTRPGFVEIGEGNYLFGRGVLRLCVAAVGPQIPWRGELWVEVTGPEVDPDGLPLTVRGGRCRKDRTVWVRAAWWAALRS